MGVVRFIELAVILVLPARVVGAVMTRGLRRKLTVYPRVIATLVVAATGLGIAMAVATRSDVLWSALTAVALLAVAIEAWRALPGFGRRRGLPPGSLAIARRAPWTDPDFLSNQIARYGAIFKMSHFVRPTVCIADMALGRELLREHDDVLAASPLPFSRLVPGGFVRYRSATTHRELSVRIRETIDNGVIERAEPELARLVEESLHAIAVRPRHPPRPSIERAVRQYFVLVFFGLEPGSPRSLELIEAMSALDVNARLRGTARSERRAMHAAQAIVLAEPGGFLEVAASRGPLDEELIVNLLYIATTTSADVSSLTCWILRRLADEPAWRERIRLDPSGAVAERVVDETLRLSQSEYIARRAIRPIRFRGVLIPCGYHVRVCIREIHRDARAFADPLTFDPDRFAVPVSGTTFAPLGISRVRCPGGHLTTMVGRRFASELSRYEVTVLDDGPIELGPFHWQPSRRFRIGLAPRTAIPERPSRVAIGEAPATQAVG